MPVMGGRPAPTRSMVGNTARAGRSMVGPPQYNTNPMWTKMYSPGGFDPQNMTASQKAVVNERSPGATLGYFPNSQPYGFHVGPQGFPVGSAFNMAEGGPVNQPQQMTNAKRNLLTVAGAHKLAGPKLAFSVMQHYRKKYDAHRAFAAAALQGNQQRPGSLQAACDAATKMYENALDGNEIHFKPAGGGVAAVITPVDGGQSQTVHLTTQQFMQFLQGEHGQFDHIQHLKGPQLLQALSQNKPAAQAGPQQGMPQPGPGEEPAPEAGEAEPPDQGGEEPDDSQGLYGGGDVEGDEPAPDDENSENNQVVADITGRAPAQSQSEIKDSNWGPRKPPVEDPGNLLGVKTFGKRTEKEKDKEDDNG